MARYAATVCVRACVLCMHARARVCTTANGVRHATDVKRTELRGEWERVEGGEGRVGGGGKGAGRAEPTVARIDLCMCVWARACLCSAQSVRLLSACVCV